MQGRRGVNSATNEWYINLAIAALGIDDLSAYDEALDTTPLTADPEPELQLRDLVIILRISVVS